VKLLLDTHTLLWAIGKTSKLSRTVIRKIKDPNNEILVSAVSLWEIALKASLGKLVVDFDIRNVPEYCEEMGFELIPLEPTDALNSSQLPQKKDHKDPFDRMLVYQSISNNYTLVSTDARMDIYKADGLRYVW